jgi:hypothetical protein
MATVAGQEDWQPVASNSGGADVVERMAIPGGWLYRNTLVADDKTGMVLGLVFVPSRQSPAREGLTPHFDISVPEPKDAKAKR